MYLDGRQQEFDYDSWFGMSTGAMDVYYSVEGTLVDTYDQYLKYEKRKAQLTGLLILCVTALVLLVSGLFVGRFIKSFSARLENIDDKMLFHWFIISISLSISFSVMSAVNEKRIREVPSGTVGGRTGRA